MPVVFPVRAVQRVPGDRAEGWSPGGLVLGGVLAEPALPVVHRRGQVAGVPVQVRLARLRDLFLPGSCRDGGHAGGLLPDSPVRHLRDGLRHAITRHEHNITSLTQLTASIDTAITRRTDTAGTSFTMTIDDRRYRNRADAGRHLTSILTAEAAALRSQPSRSLRPGHLAGFPLTARLGRSLGQLGITLELEGAPGTTITMNAADLADTDPTGLITRLEHRVHRLEQRKTETLDRIETARREIDHATTALASPFPLAAELTTARHRASRINDQLATKPSEPEKEIPEPAPGILRPARQEPDQTALPQPRRLAARQAASEADFEAGQ